MAALALLDLLVVGSLRGRTSSTDTVSITMCAIVIIRTRRVNMRIRRTSNVALMRDSLARYYSMFDRCRH